MAEVIFNVKVQIGKVYAYNSLRGHKCVGDGYKCLCNFIHDVSKGKHSISEIEAKIEETAKRIAQDTEMQPLAIFVNIDEETYDAIEVAELPNHVYVLTRPHLPEVMECVPLVEAPEPPVPSYRSKLLAYDKRRNYSQKNKWNRIRSRLF